MLKKESADKVIALLAKEYPTARPALLYSSEFELLVAVILSAQCTDARVNIVTRKLFAVANTPEKILELGKDKLEQYIRSCGLYKNKAKHIISASRSIIDDFGGQVPSTVKELEKLDGVGRKTANVVFSVAFGGDAIAVDTHVFRVSKRIGLANKNTPLEVEKQLCKIIDKADWSKAHHYLIYHGRTVCKAQKPNCQDCVIFSECERKINNKKMTKSQ